MVTERELELLAVIEKAKALPHGPFGPWEDDLVSWDALMAVLASVDTSALTAVKAEAWDEGRAAEGEWVGDGRFETRPVNPYRALAEGEKNRG